MGSPESRKLIALFESMQVKAAMEKEHETGEHTGKFDSPEPPQDIAGQLSLERTRFKESNIFRLTPKEGANETHIFYLHGGGYVNTFTIFHWHFLNSLIQRLQCTVTAPDYPLAPKHPYPDAFDLVSELYMKTAAQTDPQHIYLMGDSAGGALCLALAQRIRDEKGALPQKIFLFSPWLDVTLKNPDVLKIDPIDPFLSVKGCIMAGKSYTGNQDPSHPFISPINGTFHDLPPISIYAGSRDILTPDARKLADLLTAQQHDVVYDEFEGMFHVWMLFDLPESKQLLEKITADLS